MNNVETYFELLENAKVINRVTYQGKTGALHDILLNIKVNKTLLFVGVEQGLGSNVDIVFVLTIPKLRSKAQR